MKEPKRKPLKGKLAPRNATTFSKICSLETDGVYNRNSWASIQEKTIFLCKQKSGHPSTEQIYISRKEFEKIIDWYNQKQQTFQ